MKNLFMLDLTMSIHFKVIPQPHSFPEFCTCVNWRQEASDLFPFFTLCCNQKFSEYIIILGVEDLDLKRFPVGKLIKVGDQYLLCQIEVVYQQGRTTEGMEPNHFLVSMSGKGSLSIEHWE